MTVWGASAQAENGPKSATNASQRWTVGLVDQRRDDFIDPLQSLTQLARRQAMGRWSNGVMPPLVSTL